MRETGLVSGFRAALKVVFRRGSEVWATKVPTFVLGFLRAFKVL